MNKNNIFDNYKDYGYWKFISYPIEYQENRINDFNVLRKLLENSIVFLRGWDFPHIDRHGNYINVPEGIQSYTTSERVSSVEKWKLFKSGFFAFKSILIEDLEKQSYGQKINKGEVLSFVGTVYTITEFIFFIKRLYTSMEINRCIRYEIILGNSFKRKLYCSPKEGKLPFLSDENYVNPNHTPINIIRKVDLLELQSNYKSLILNDCKEIFQLFQWNNPNIEQIKKDIDDFLNRKIY